MLLPSIFNDNFVDGLFDDMFSFPSRMNMRQRQGSTLMNTDIQDLGQEYQLEMELPGFDKQDVKAQLHDGYLTVAAKKESSEESKDENGKYVRRERYSGSCQRSFYVGKNLKETDIQAAFDNGVLKLTFPKEEHREVIDETKYIAIQ